jgi:hypothetical protein
MRTRSVCLLVNETFEAPSVSTKRRGFKVAGYYDTIFLKQQKHGQ